MVAIHFLLFIANASWALDSCVQKDPLQAQLGKLVSQPEIESEASAVANVVLSLGSKGTLSKDEVGKLRYSFRTFKDAFSSSEAKEFQIKKLADKLRRFRKPYKILPVPPANLIDKRFDARDHSTEARRMTLRITSQSGASFDLTAICQSTFNCLNEADRSPVTCYIETL